jgi:glycosyltransferase involved in cell wall biosynthesis
MRYLDVISSLDPQGGGPAEGIRQLCRAAQQSGHRCEVVSLDAPGAPWLADFPCPVHALGPGSFGNYRYAPRLVSWLKKNASRFDAVIVNGLWQYHGLAVRQALRRSATPYFVFAHGMLDPWFKREYPLKHLKKWLYWPWGEYRVLRDARAVIFTSETERRQARESFPLYRAAEMTATYGTQGPSGDANAQRAAFLARFPELRGKRLLLFLGRLHPKKGCDLLIEAFASVAGSDTQAHLVMAGPDAIGWRPDLVRNAERRRVAGRITWTGMLSGDLKWGAMHSADAFVLPSHQENFGVAVAEALACGIPVLISDKVNICDEVAAAGAGLVAADTLHGTAGLLAEWLALPVLERRAMAGRAEALFRDRFRVDAAARALVAGLEQRIGSTRQPAPTGSSQDTRAA